VVSGYRYVDLGRLERCKERHLEKAGSDYHGLHMDEPINFCNDSVDMLALATFVVSLAIARV
jgi:hypothetical protein